MSETKMGANPLDSYREQLFILQEMCGNKNVALIASESHSEPTILAKELLSEINELEAGGTLNKEKLKRLALASLATLVRSEIIGQTRSRSQRADLEKKMFVKESDFEGYALQGVDPTKLVDFVNSLLARSSTSVEILTIMNEFELDNPQASNLTILINETLYHKNLELLNNIKSS